MCDYTVYHICLPDTAFETSMNTKMIMTKAANQISNAGEVTKTKIQRTMINNIPSTNPIVNRDSLSMYTSYMNNLYFILFYL